MKLRQHYLKMWQKAGIIQPDAAKVGSKRERVGKGKKSIFLKIRKKVQKLENAAIYTQFLQSQSSIPLPLVLEWGDLRFNTATLEASYASQLLDLTAKECHLLELFLQNGRRVLNRSEILQRLWTPEDAPSAETIKAHITHLRHKLQAGGAPTDLIETVYGLGYCLKKPPEC